MTEDEKKRFEELEEKILGWAERYAEKNGWELNREDNHASVVVKGLAKNRVMYGARYCPCRIRSGDPKADRDIICPCKFHRDEIAQDGYCHCMLFKKKEE